MCHRKDLSLDIDSEFEVVDLKTGHYREPGRVKKSGFGVIGKWSHFQINKARV